MRRRRRQQQQEKLSALRLPPAQLLGQRDREARPPKHRQKDTTEPKHLSQVPGGPGPSPYFLLHHHHHTNDTVTNGASASRLGSAGFWPRERESSTTYDSAPHSFNPASSEEHLIEWAWEGSSRRHFLFPQAFLHLGPRLFLGELSSRPGFRPPPGAGPIAA